MKVPIEEKDRAKVCCFETKDFTMDSTVKNKGPRKV
ncbi:hypothetical protein V6Z12_D09G126200 [Gossypium hirsutum]